MPLATYEQYIDHRCVYISSESKNQKLFQILRTIGCSRGATKVYAAHYSPKKVKTFKQ